MYTIILLLLKYACQHIIALTLMGIHFCLSREYSKMISQCTFLPDQNDGISYSAIM